MGISGPIPVIPLSDAVSKAARACAYGLPIRQIVPMPCQTDKARNNAGKWPRFERTMPTPPTIGGMPGFFENEALRRHSGDPGAKPGSEQPCQHREGCLPSEHPACLLPVCPGSLPVSCRKPPANTNSFAHALAYTHTRTREDASVPMITIGSPVDNLGSPQEREKEPKR